LLAGRAGPGRIILSETPGVPGRYHLGVKEQVMGYNRSGKTRKDRLKRRKKQEQRLTRKAAEPKAPTPGK
jgi:hypothetical protein